MKVIDILNKIANREIKDEFRFKYDGDVYNFNGLQFMDEEGCSLGGNLNLGLCLNDEVEVIEEKKEIAELNDTNYDENLIDKETYHNLTRKKLNEVIRAVNKLTKEREEK